MDHISAEIPFLRRYARALTGSQESGDATAMAVLEALIAAPERVPEAGQARLELFVLFHEIWDRVESTPHGEEPTGTRAARAQMRLSELTPLTREALLLNALEDFVPRDVAHILKVDPDKAEELIETGKRELAASARGSVLIIEDEPIIAMDLESIVSDAGHSVFGVARTRTEAVEVGTQGRPDLILADIRLADESSGIDAVNDLLEEHTDVPVIFITAYPEMLLTGDKPEPAFLITKPFRADQVLSSISQAMFFSSTETLNDA